MQKHLGVQNTKADPETRWYTHHAGEDLFQRFSRRFCFGSPSGQTVRKREQRLSHRIGIRNLPVVDQSQVPNSPALKNQAVLHQTVSQRTYQTPNATAQQRVRSRRKRNVTRRHLAMLHPKVPEPRSKHLVCATLSRFSSGSNRHRISFKLRSTADSANLRDTQQSVRLEVTAGVYHGKQ